MVRIGISLYLMLATLAGPAFCCCTTGHLLELFIPQAKQTSSSRCCCQGHHGNGHNEHPGSGQNPCKKNQDGFPSCPCQEHQSPQVALVFPESDGDAQLQLGHALDNTVDLLFAFSTSFALHLDGLPDIPREAAVLPFLTVQDILRTLHILRC